MYYTISKLVCYKLIHVCVYVNTNVSKIEVNMFVTLQLTLK